MRGTEREIRESIAREIMNDAESVADDPVCWETAFRAAWIARGRGTRGGTG